VDHMGGSIAQYREKCQPTLRQGHEYCKDCLTTWVREKGTCPTCREAVGREKTLTKNRLGYTTVGKLAVRCPERNNTAGVGGGGDGAARASSAAVASGSGGRKRRRGGAAAAAAQEDDDAAEGCAWTGTVSGLDAHVRVCEFVKVRTRPVCLPTLLQSLTGNTLGAFTHVAVGTASLPPAAYQGYTTFNLIPPTHDCASFPLPHPPAALSRFRALTRRMGAGR
jgi:hypothetical protein